jgi:hypothetical protein
MNTERKDTLMNRRLRHALAIIATVGPLGLIITPPSVKAQEPTPAPPGQTAEATLNGKKMRALADVLALMSRSAGADVVADSTVAQAMVPMPMEKATPENVESQVAALAKALPRGTTWAKLYLPSPRGRAGFNGDDVAQYAQAQARLLGTVGAPTPAGTVEILGQRVPADQAATYITGLNLKPVYLLTNPLQSRLANANADPSQWNGMTPDQRRQYAQAQASQLAGMDPAQRDALLQQSFMIFNQAMRLLPPDQRQSVLQGAMGPGQQVHMVFKGDGPPAGGGGGGGVVITPAP